MLYTSLLFLRTTLFKGYLTLWTLMVGLIGIPVFLFQHPALIRFIGSCWAGGLLWGLRHCCGLTYTLQHAPFPQIADLRQSTLLIASKHQSAWETIFFLWFFQVPAFVLKRELCRIPIYGWYLYGLGMIPVDRAGKSAALKKMLLHAKKALARKRSLVIFPEGTRI
jgi:1-acyl-sn-glycerol-3-phosphate acyltransferase